MKTASTFISDFKELDRSYASCKYNLDEAKQRYAESGWLLDEAQQEFNRASRSRAFNYVKFYFVSILKLLRGSK
jgi:hypothetical protein